uniref:DUF362 domain-containing protein n=1 Tax=Steinernema glaseri TaxID=37863 RepID=A0A1I7Y4A1_9BILA
MNLATYGKDSRCKERIIYDLYGNYERLRLEHLSKVAAYAREELKLKRVLVWYDSIAGIDTAILEEYDLGSLVTPVIWHYEWNSGDPAAFPNGMFAQFSNIFDNVLFAGIYKGSNGETQNVMEMQRYLPNLLGHLHNCGVNNNILNGTLTGMVLTGRSRYKHGAGLCELIPESIPTLVTELISLNDNHRMEQKELVDTAVQYLEYSIKEQDPLNPKIIVTSDFELYYAHTFERPLDSLFVNTNFPGNDVFIE